MQGYAQKSGEERGTLKESSRIPFQQAAQTDNEPMRASIPSEARIGSLTADREWFKPWRTISGTTLADPHLPELQIMIEGIFHKRRLLDLIGYFILFEDSGGGPLSKKIAAYHQFHAVNVAVWETLRAAQAREGADSVAESRGGYKLGSSPAVSPGTSAPA